MGSKFKAVMLQGLACKAKAKDLTCKAKAKDLTFEAKAKMID